MRFAILGSRGFPSHYGGFETLVRHLAPYLVHHGHDVVVYGRSTGGRSIRVVDGIEVRRTRGLEQKSTSTLSYGLSAALDVARDPVDAVLVLNVANAFWLRRLKRAGMGTCINVDGLEWLRGKWGPLARHTFRHGARVAARDADELIFDSKELRRVWIDLFGRDGRYIPYGARVLSSHSCGHLRQAGLPQSGYVLAVARIVPENNIDLLLDCLPRLQPSAEVIVVGGANYSNDTVTRLRALAETGRIHWLGHVADQELLDELWVNAGVYWHGHSVGGTNPALLQALGAGAPTLALDTPFNREVLADDEQLVPHDKNVLATRIGQVLASRELASTFRERGQAIIAERYSWDDACGTYCDLLERLAQRLPRTATAKRPFQSVRRRPRPQTRPKACFVAVVGPDGSGKSTLVADLQANLRPEFPAGVSVVNFRSRHIDRLLGRRIPHSDGGSPHGLAPRTALGATLKALVLWGDLVLSARAWRRGGKRLTLVERYSYDLIVDPYRLGVSRAPELLRRRIVDWTPRPDAVVLCRAEAPVIGLRKRELATAEIDRQYRVWSTLRSNLRTPFLEVETDDHLDVDQIAAELMEVVNT